MGKSSLALTFAIAAAARGEHSAIFAFDEGRGTMSARAHARVPLWRTLESGRIDFNRSIQPNCRPANSQTRFGEASSATVRIVIIDSLNGYLNAMPDERFLDPADA